VTQHRPRPASLPVCAVLCGLLAAIGILAAPPAPAGPQASPSPLAPSVETMPPATVLDAEVSVTARAAAPAGAGGDHPDPAPPGSPDVRAAAPSRPGDLARSLVYSGLFGLAISITGLTLIVSRRRSW
jgi:hypothetical protein